MSGLTGMHIKHDSEKASTLIRSVKTSKNGNVKDYLFGAILKCSRAVSDT